MTRILCSLTLLSLACAGTDRAAPSVTHSSAGDTTVITSHGVVSVVWGDSVRVVWQSPDLEDPQGMTLVGTRLVVGDRHQLHVIDTATAAVTTVGREGKGPGEFGAVNAVAAWQGDSIAAYDGRLQRLSIFGPDLAFARSMPLTPRVPFVNPRQPPGAMRRAGAGLFVIRQENVHVDEPTRSALEWLDPAADSATVLRVWPDFTLKRLADNVLGPEQLYGPHLNIALSATRPVFAHGDGVDYCVTVEPLTVRHGDAGVRRFCRDWQATPAGPGLRHPEFTGIRDGNTRRMLTDAAAKIPVADYLPAYDELRFDERGRLWVRTLGPEMADLHPWLLARFPELGPAVRRWDVFDADGGLRRTVELRGRFEPRVILPDGAYGFYTLPTGEVVIGFVRLPAIE